ncbi:MAG: alpha/beta hydrolase [Desulfosarcina sp.]
MYVHFIILTKMKKDITIVLLFALVAYPLIVIAAHGTQSYVIFQSRGASMAPPEHFDIDEVMLPTPDGERLYAWWLRVPHAEKTILYFQENGTNISYRTSRLRTFDKMGLNALLIDYRGYGKSTGRIKQEAHIYNDGATAWNYLVAEKGIQPQDIIVWGRSLGGGVAAEIAQYKNIAALILESTFYSLNDIARRQYWFLPTTWLLDFRFENGRKLKHVSAPVIIIHSQEDDYIPFGQASKLFDSASEPKTILKTTGSHLDTIDDQEAVLAALMAWLAL